MLNFIGRIDCVALKTTGMKSNIKHYLYYSRSACVLMTFISVTVKDSFPVRLCAYAERKPFLASPLGPSVLKPHLRYKE